MQQYMSHKIVEAMRIDQILVVPDSDVVQLTSVSHGAPITQPVLREWVEKKVPGEDIAEKLSKLVGGYFVKYPGSDGYTSWSPASAFESGYTAIPEDYTGDGMYALNALRQGHKVARHGWNGKGMFLFLVQGSTFTVNRPPLLGIYPEGTEINYRPHIDMRTADGSIVPWVASQSDILANDWYIVE